MEFFTKNDWEILQRTDKRLVVVQLVVTCTNVQVICSAQATKEMMCLAYVHLDKIKDELKTKILANATEVMEEP